MLARAGFENVEKDNAYNGMTLREWARMSLTERGIGVASYNPMQMVGLALTHSTSDFGIFCWMCRTRADPGLGGIRRNLPEVDP